MSNLPVIPEESPTLVPDSRILVTEDDIRARKLIQIEKQIKHFELLFGEHYNEYMEHKHIADSLMHDIELLRAEQQEIRGEIRLPPADIKQVGMIQAMQIYNHIILECLPNLKKQEDWYRQVADQIVKSF